MPGRRQARRSVNSLYMRDLSPPATEEDPSPEPATRRTRRGRPTDRPRTVQPASTPLVEEDDDQEVEQEDDQEAALAIVGGSTSTATGSTSSGVYLRGPSKLLAGPIPIHRHPLIQP
jgi:hypothetical protein